MMRIFIDTELAIGQDVTAPERVQRHVTTVLRHRPGDRVVLFNGRGGEYAATIVAQSRRELRFRVDEFLPCERESPLGITLVQGISRGERMDYSIQKAVELGVTDIVPLQARRTNVKLSAERAASRRAHWEGVIRHACEQCGRNRLPRLDAIRTLEDIVDAAPADARFVLHPVAGHAALPSSSRPDRVALVVGPEGGLDDEELRVLDAAGWQRLRLGPRVLRTETATVAGLVLLQIRFGDLAPDAPPQ